MSKFKKLVEMIERGLEDRQPNKISGNRLEQDMLKYEELKKWVQSKDVGQFDSSDADSMAIHKEFIAKIKEFVDTFELSGIKGKQQLMAQLASTPSVGQILTRLYNAIMAGAGLEMGKGKPKFK